MKKRGKGPGYRTPNWYKGKIHAKKKVKKVNDPRNQT
jgi:hypothetical protein